MKKRRPAHPAWNSVMKCIELSREREAQGLPPLPYNRPRDPRLDEPDPLDE